MAYNVSKKYKEKRYSGDNDNQLYLEYNGIEVKNVPLKAENLKWVRRILDNGSKTLTLDNFVSQTIELSIRDYEVSDTTKEFYIKIGSMVDGAYEYAPLGYYHIKDNPSTANGKTTYKLTDRSTRFDKYIDLSEFIKQNGGKITKLQAVQEYCRQCNVEFANTSFLGSNEEIGIYDNTITARVHIMYLAECSGCIATIGRDGKLYFIPFVKPNSNNTHIIPERILNNNMNNSKGSFKISKVVWEGALMPFEKGNDTGDTLFLNTSNPYISKQEDIDRIYEQVVGLEIDNINTSSIIGDPSIDPWDYIQYTHTDDNGNNKGTYTSLAQYDLEFNGVFKQSFNTSIDREKKKINSTVNSQNAKVNRLKQEIDNVNGVLKVTSEKVDENTSKIGSLEISNQGITTKISTLETGLNTTNSNLENTNSRVDTLDGKIDGISADFNDFKDNEYIQSINNLQDQIDGAIQFWNGASIPTLENYPANEWTTENDRNNHRADIYTVIDDSTTPPKQGKSYRFDKVNGVWQWIELTDNELSAVQAIAQEALDKAKANAGNIDVLTQKTSELTQTDEQIKASVTEINNKYEQDITISKTASGNPIVVTDAGEYLLESIEIEGKSEQNGTPTPDTPVEIKTVKGKVIEGKEGSWLKIKTTGKNLLDSSKYISSKTTNGITYTNNGDGTFNLVGTATANTTITIIPTGEIKLEAKQPYYLYSSQPYNLTTFNMSIPMTDNGSTKFITANNTYTPTTTPTNVRLEFYLGVGDSVNAINVKLMLVKGKQATEYEPYKENTALIDMNIYDKEGNITGHHEFAEIGYKRDTFKDGLLTKRIGKVVLDGSEEWRQYPKQTLDNTSFFTYESGLKFASENSLYCSHFQFAYIWGNDVAGIYLDTNETHTDNIRIRIPSEKASTKEEFKQWLSENNVEVYYQLATPIEHNLNYEILELHEGYNNITLNDELLPNMNIKYLTDSKLNAQYVSHAQLEIEKNKINSEINTKVSNTELGKVIEEQNNKFTQQITESENSTKSELTKQINTAKTEAINSSNNTTTEKLKSYSTTTQMNNAISQSITASENKITSQVSNTYITKTDSEKNINSAKTEAINSANNSTDDKLKSYPTTTTMNNTIEQQITGSENKIMLEVNKKVDNDTVTRAYIINKINDESSTIQIGADNISLEGFTTINKGFSVDLDGNATMNNSTMNNAEMNNATINGGSITLKDQGGETETTIVINDETSYEKVYTPFDREYQNGTILTGKEMALVIPDSFRNPQNASAKPIFSSSGGYKIEYYGQSYGGGWQWDFGIKMTNNNDPNFEEVLYLNSWYMENNAEEVIVYKETYKLPDDFGYLNGRNETDYNGWLNTFVKQLTRYNLINSSGIQVRDVFGSRYMNEHGFNAQTQHGSDFMQFSADVNAAPSLIYARDNSMMIFDCMADNREKDYLSIKIDGEEPLRIEKSKVKFFGENALVKTANVSFNIIPSTNRGNNGFGQAKVDISSLKAEEILAITYYSGSSFMLFNTNSITLDNITVSGYRMGGAFNGTIRCGARILYR